MGGKEDRRRLRAAADRILRGLQFSGKGVKMHANTASVKVNKNFDARKILYDVKIFL